ncbi:MAG: hypothetical protein PHI71_09855, partial [Acidiphilium sp.]|nr:hypothetical protein [Acidiphilium sp.]
ETFIGTHRHQRFDDLIRRLLHHEPDKERHGLASPRNTEGDRGITGDVVIKIFKQFDQAWNRRGPKARRSTGAGAQIGFARVQRIMHDSRWHPCPEPRGRLQGKWQTGFRNDMISEQSLQRCGCLGATNRRQSRQGYGLLANRMGHPEPLEPSAQRIERRNGPGDLTADGLIHVG